MFIFVSFHFHLLSVYIPMNLFVLIVLVCCCSYFACLRLTGIHQTAAFCETNRDVSKKESSQVSKSLSFLLSCTISLKFGGPQIQKKLMFCRLLKFLLQPEYRNITKRLFYHACSVISNLRLCTAKILFAFPRFTEILSFLVICWCFLSKFIHARNISFMQVNKFTKLHIILTWNTIITFIYICRGNTSKCSLLKSN